MRSTNNSAFTATVLLLAGLAFGVQAQLGIAHTLHNLSASGRGEIKSSDEQQICIFCHASHMGGGSAPLWNRQEAATAFTTYGSPTSQSGKLQPGTGSRLCLSCHDGTTALGLVGNRPEQIRFPAGLGRIPLGRKSNLNTDLSDDHPLALAPGHSTMREYVCSGCHQSAGGSAKEMSCSSCHDAHDNSHGSFLKREARNGSICLQCHALGGWASGSHSQSRASIASIQSPGGGSPRWATVADGACDNCHVSHGAGGRSWLLRYPNEEENCYACHNGRIARTDVASGAISVSGHPVRASSGIHAPNENPLTMERHVECTDCHDPHRTSSSPAPSPMVSGALAGVSGVNIGGDVVEHAAYEYEVCLKCHLNARPGTRWYVPRHEPQTGIRREFGASARSFHPVASEGKNRNVPSLIYPYNADSRISCTACHTGQNADVPGGVKGPHSSAYAPILGARMVFTDFSHESAANYALCYQCHDRNVILGSGSATHHRLHIVDARTSCTTCHDPHGSADNAHLINFNTDYVTASGSGRLSYFDDGAGGGTCYLSCHGVDHDPQPYRAGAR